MKLRTLFTLTGALNTLKRFNSHLGNKGEALISEPEPTPEPTPGPEPEPTPPVSWKEMIPEEVRADPIYDRYKTVGEALKSVHGSAKFLGREKLPVPVDENDAETLDIIADRLGRPKTAGDYQTPTDVEMPAELPMDESLLNAYKEMAHKNRYTPAQFKEGLNLYQNNLKEAYEKQQEAMVTATAEADVALRKEWGGAYTQNLSLAKTAFEHFAGEAGKAEFARLGLGANPVVMKMLHGVGKAMSEDIMGGSPGGGMITPQEAQSEINAINGNPKHPYWQADHPQHSEALANMERLHKMLNPE